MQKKRILVAVLNWGLGHATRCISIIRELQAHNFEVLIASDGAALQLLQKEFPSLKYFELPSYNISYSKSAGTLKWKLISKAPKILQAIKKEKTIIKTLVEKHKLDGIISDNRFGCRHKQVKSVFITHQFNVLSGNTTYLSSKIHQRYISKFDECWIPDVPGNYNLSGIMGHLKEMPKNLDYLGESPRSIKWKNFLISKQASKPLNLDYRIKYIGTLSRFNKVPHQKRFDFAVILSGPEPQRSMLEEKLLDIFKATDKNIIFIRGVIQEKCISLENREFREIKSSGGIKIKNYLTSKTLEKAILSSDFVICRSGYSSIMDLAKLEKKAFLIPTPGQFEQEYLAERFSKLGIAPFCKQDDFELSKLEELKGFSGFNNFNFSVDFREVFSLF